MRKLIAQLIFYNLNRWQIRNEGAHASESAEDYEKTRDRFQATIKALYQMTAESDETSSIYRQPLEDILVMTNELLSNWLHSHKAWTSHRASQVHTAQHDQDHFTHETER